MDRQTENKSSAFARHVFFVNLRGTRSLPEKKVGRRPPPRLHTPGFSGGISKYLV